MIFPSEMRRAVRLALCGCFSNLGEKIFNKSKRILKGEQIIEINSDSQRQQSVV